jgi:hypothetical protein
MKILYCPAQDNSLIDLFLTEESVDFERIDLWDNSIDIHGGHNLQDLLACNEKQLLIINNSILESIMCLERSKQQLFAYINQSNGLWIWNDSDSANSLVPNPPIDELNRNINPGMVTYFLDGVFTKTDLAKKYGNINFAYFPATWWIRVYPYIKARSLEKKSCQKQFLLTTIKQQGSWHREILWQKLQTRNLLPHGHAFYKTKQEPWIGEISKSHTWNDGYPSMDLYLDCWLEIVPETRYDDLCLITEKTGKPIATKTPFLMLSTPSYLKYLKNNGFKTFDNLIDESYDTEHVLENRVDMILDQLEFIIKNGAEDFYKASSEILDHNQQRLFEITGGWKFHMNQFIRENMSEYIS